MAIDEDEVATLLKAPRRKNGLQFPPHPIQFISWTYMILSLLSVSILLLPFIASLVSKILLSLLFAALFILTIAFGVKTAAYDVGEGAAIISVGCETEKSPESSSNIEASPQGVYCHICRTDVYLDALHCKYCNKCVRGLDHHCFYLHNCIGRQNYRMFIATLISVLLLSIYIFLGFLLGYLYGVPQSFEIYSTSLVWLILALIQSILSLIVATYIVYLLLIHSVLIYYGITTLEYSRAIRQGRLKYFFFYQSPRISPSS